ncbi:hypothetical protein RO3G_09360 [Rhizopus delemar RA 99-880]|uniref:DH domain-containing protein n=1 Tax=Rhizopus delemar (strain RA 99-880 / ATCC MYA-4621 / FGSC 9543 / NRRL 43880) TaxID=246409 RepID=I1C870_RHIO9|nr:hypothetical protein RO3G_09360 [Rhizopus delemar RA 99-880]|eukprot:EIE84650.1 hypothetical protein RO3G_09360 [Rhizopus delemar RA 99-880]
MNVHFISCVDTTLIDNQKYYNQVVEDLLVIDNVCDMFEEEEGYEPILSARHVAYKRQTVNQIIQSETSYLNEFYDFQETYATRMQVWLDATEDKDVTLKLKSTPAKKTLNALFQSLHELSVIHTKFLKEITDRFQMWGPTQLISDIFNDFYKCLDTYEIFFEQHAEFVVTKINVNKQRQSSLKIADIEHYLQIPVNRISHYSKFLQQLKNYSEHSNPDYVFLGQMAEKFKALDNEWSERKKSCQAHLMVLEASRTIQNCPVNVTLDRRLILHAELIKVDLDDLTSVSDVRTYYLFSDYLIYCRKQKDRKDGLRKLVYKGNLNLRGAEVRGIRPLIASKMCEVKKPLFRIGKKSADTASTLKPEVFGFELIIADTNIDTVAPMYFSNGSLPPQMALGPVRQRHIFRTRSIEEQTLWRTSLEKVINTISQPSQES